MKEKYFFDVVINKEKLSTGKIVYVAHCTTLGITSQGFNTEEAMKNIKEAVQLYLEEMPEKYEELISLETPLFSMVEVEKDAKIAHHIRAWRC